MPTPAKTSRQEILTAAIEMIEDGGIRGLTMIGVAKKVGIKGASLYKHFKDADEILLALEILLQKELAGILSQTKSLREMVGAFLEFTKARRALLPLMFRSGEPAQSRQSMVMPLEYLERLLGDREEALLRLRILTSMLYGYSLMLSDNAFRQEGDLTKLTERALQLIVPEEIHEKISREETAQDPS
jgi:AcrR family transcriptional regulator